MTGISRSRWRRASCLCLLLAGCGGGRGQADPGEPRPSPGGTIPLEQAIMLETAGPPPPDTSVTFTAGEPHTIILRHGPPDNVEFMELSFPQSTFQADSGRPVRVDVQPRPGLYGIDLTTSLTMGTGATLVFKYARYFSAPAQARAIYGSDIRFEQALAIGQLRPDGQLAFLPSIRPAADNLQARLTGPGEYLVAAAR